MIRIKIFQGFPDAVELEWNDFIRKYPAVEIEKIIMKTHYEKNWSRAAVGAVVGIPVVILVMFYKDSILIRDNP